MVINMETIDLSRLEIEWVDGSKKEPDIHKEAANIIFANASSIVEHLFAIELFKNPVVELTDENRRILVKFLTPDFGFAYFIKEAILKLAQNG